MEDINIVLDAEGYKDETLGAIDSAIKQQQSKAAKDVLRKLHELVRGFGGRDYVRFHCDIRIEKGGERLYAG